jgi:endoglucanase
MVGQFGIPDTDPRWLKLTEVFLKYLADNKMNANYWASGKRWNGNPLSIYPLAQTDRPQITALQAYLKPQPIETKPVIPEVSIQPEPAVLQQPQALPESFLFLPGTTLLPQPNGGLYKPTPSKTSDTITTTNSIRVAKYRS